MVKTKKERAKVTWTKEDLLEALTNMKERQMSLSEAARRYRISRTTLYRHFKTFHQEGAQSDVNQFQTCRGNTILTKVEEDVLENTIMDLREQGFEVTSTDLKRICFEYCDSNGIPNQFNQEKRMASDDWYYGFLKRHPDVIMDKSGEGPIELSELEQELEIPKGKKKLKKRSGGSKKSGGGGGGDCAPDISAEFALAGSSAFAASAAAGSSYKSSRSGGESPTKLEKAISNKRAKIQQGLGKRKSSSSPSKGSKRKKKNNGDTGDVAEESNSIFLEQNENVVNQKIDERDDDDDEEAEDATEDTEEADGGDEDEDEEDEDEEEEVAGTSMTSETDGSSKAEDVDDDDDEEEAGDDDDDDADETAQTAPTLSSADDDDDDADETSQTAPTLSSADAVVKGESQSSSDEDDDDDDDEDDD